MNSFLKLLKAKLCGPSPLQSADYVHDGLAVWNKNVSFLSDPKFQRAYARGQNSGHKLTGSPHKPLHVEWRVHVLLSMAAHAAKLPGDFVECGVNTGVFSLSVCDYLDFDQLGKKFYLFDTYEGIPADQMSEHEKSLGRIAESERYYEECFETAKRNFSEFKQAILIKGRVPDSLVAPESGSICYLSLDMNIAAPEIAALNFFWNKLSPGAPVILDDYGWKPYRPQKTAIDEFAAAHGVAVCELPTGQGLMFKPPNLK